MPGPGVPFTGRIVVRLASFITDAVRRQLVTTPTLAPQGLAGVLAAIQQTSPSPEIGSLQSHLANNNALQAQTIITPAWIGEVATWESNAYHGPLPPLHSLFSYWIVDYRGVAATRSLEATVADVANHAGVDIAYKERNLREPAWVVTADALTSTQGYVFGAGNESVDGTFGVNANHSAVWKRFSGAGVGFVDIERGWRYSHQDFPPRLNVQNPDPGGNGTLIGLNTPGLAAMHGTRSVAVAVGVDHAGAGAGMVGVAPGASLLGVASRVSDDGQDEWRLSAAITEALGVMRAGDVLLIEAETAGGVEGGYPVEVDDHHFDAIRLAAGIGMVVIEPAGNGWTGIVGGVLQENAHNLNDPLPPRPGNVVTPVLNRLDPNFTDSGAIMVAACASTTQPAGGHERLVKSSYGSRIDCYAWGEDVVAPYTLGADPDVDYSADFGGTSAASAIIAGTALLVQEMAVASAFPRNRLSPSQIRALLRNSGFGTPIYDIGAAAGALPIGTMPDLVKIAAQIGLLPDVFIRDHVGDDGSIPSLNSAVCPDIIVRSTAVGNPQIDLGEGSAVAEQLTFNDDVLLNQKSYLYVRVRNRGEVPALGVTATVYWAEAAAMIPPSDWKLIGTSKPLDVPAAGGTIGVPYGPLAVTQAIEWTPTKTTLPVAHACFIAVLDHPLDPAPPPLTTLGTAAINWTTFLQFVQGQNNVAWRNFNVLELSADAGGNLLAEAAFSIIGAPDEAAAFDFHFQRAGDRDHQWLVRMPTALARGLHLNVKRTRGGAAARSYELAVPERGVRFPLVGLTRRSRHRCLIRVRVPGDKPHNDSAMSVIQTYRGQIVGRVTFVITEQSWRHKR